MREYTIVVERAEAKWSAYSPDLPGVVAVGDTQAKCEANMTEAISIYLEEMSVHALSPNSPVS